MDLSLAPKKRRITYQRARALPPLSSDKILLEVLGVRLQLIRSFLGEWTYDIDDLTEVASLISDIERILSRFYDVPSQIYDFSDGYFSCNFPSCRGRRRMKGAYHFNAHLEVHHSFLKEPLRSTKCLSCDADFQSTNGLIGHERTRHKWNYRSRSELVAPYFRYFDTKQSCRDLLDSSSFTPSTSEPRRIPSEPRKFAQLDEHQTHEIDTSEKDRQSPHFTSPDYDLSGLPAVTYPSIACSDNLDFLCNFSLSPTALPGIECSDISESSQLLQSTDSSLFDDLHFEG